MKNLITALCITSLLFIMTCGKMPIESQSSVDSTQLFLAITTAAVVNGADYRVMITDIDGVILDSISHGVPGSNVMLTVPSGSDRIIIVDKRLGTVVIEHFSDTVNLEPGPYPVTAVLVAVPPTIVTDPVETLSAFVGDTVRFGVDAAGSGMHYKWLKGSAVLSDTTDSLEIIVTIADSGKSYKCVAYNDAGSDTSAATILMVSKKTFVLAVEILPDSTAGSVTLATGDTSFANVGTFEALAAVSLFPAEAEGYRFVGFTRVPTVVKGVGMVTVRKDDTVTATFEPLLYGVDVGVLGNGTVTVNDSSVVPDSLAYKSTVTLVAEPAHGSSFVSWVGDTTGLGSDVRSESITITMPAATLHLTAKFRSVPAYPVYCSAQPVEGGTVISSAQTADSGSDVRFVALPSRGYELSAWTGATTIAGTDSAVLTVSDTATVKAVFVPSAYTITLDKSGPGTGTVAGDPANLSGLPFGTSVTLTATPSATTSVFAGWTGNTAGLDSMSPIISFTVDTARTLTAIFDLKLAGTQVVTTSIVTDSLSNAGGSITRSPDSAQYHTGTKVTVTATAKPGFVFTGWSGDTASAAVSGNTATTWIASSDLTFEAHFRDTTVPVLSLRNAGTDNLTIPSDRTVLGVQDTEAVADDAVDGNLTGSIHTVVKASSLHTYPRVDTVVYTVRDGTGNADTLVQLITRVQATRTITVSIDPSAAGSVTGAGTFDLGSPQTIVATANTGWVFDHWSTGITDTASSLDIVLDFDTAITAHFSLKPVQLSIESREYGSVQVVIGGRTHPPVSSSALLDTTLQYGTLVDLQAVENVANDSESYAFECWIVGNDSTTYTSSAESFQVTDDVSVVAKFSRIAKNRFVPTFQTVAGRGTVSWISTQNINGYVAGTVIKVRGVPNAGYRFREWSNVQSLLPTSTSNDIVTTGDSLVCDINQSGTVYLDFLDTAKPVIALRSGLKDTVGVDSGAVISAADTGCTASDNDKLAGIVTTYRTSGTAVPRTDTLVYTASDTSGNSAVVRQRVIIRKPLKISAVASKAFSEGVASTLALTPTGASGTVVYTVVDPSSQVTASMINATTGLLSWTPGFTSASASRAVIFTATDALGRVAKDTVAISVLNVNRAPVISAMTTRRTLSVDSAAAEVVSVTASDPDGDAVTYAVTLVSGTTAKGAFSNITTSGVLTVRRGTNDSAKFAIAVSDAGGLVARDTLTVLKPTCVVGLVDSGLTSDNAQRCMYRINEPALTKFELIGSYGSKHFIADSSKSDSHWWMLDAAGKARGFTNQSGWGSANRASLDMTAGKLSSGISYVVGTDSLVYSFNGTTTTRIGAGTLKASKCDVDADGNMMLLCPGGASPGVYYKKAGDSTATLKVAYTYGGTHKVADIAFGGGRLYVVYNQNDLTSAYFNEYSVNTTTGAVTSIRTLINLGYQTYSIEVDAAGAFWICRAGGTYYLPKDSNTWSSAIPLARSKKYVSVGAFPAGR